MATFLAGCLLAGATLAGLGLAALVLAAGFGAGTTPGERMCDRLLAATCLAVTLVQLAGFAGVLYAWPVALAAVGCGALGLLRGARAALASARSDFSAG
ncbi:MAG TPA: hypothetical protein VJR89_05495, partial [Polyangiales bacterium]|nr:hypothetical protein [Polyangiales bacterium]